MVTTCGYENYNSKESTEGHKDESKEDAAENTVHEEKEEDSPVPVVTHVNNILHLNFSIVEV